jgi:hypothetical protein
MDKSKVIPVTSHDTSRILHFPDIRLTDGGEFISLTHRLRFTPQEDSWYSFLLKSAHPGTSVGKEGLRTLKKKIIFLIGNLTHDLQACAFNQLLYSTPTKARRRVVG